ncbi:MAG: PIN domain-containing protein [Pyrinomonadaceae bacterium]|nr:PIN domain-containing protein [Pyrinomonadaceae bacterium]
MIKALLDTDINLDFILQRQPFFVEADEIFLRRSNGDFEAYVCDITPMNIFYIGRKEVGRQKTIQAIADLLTMAKVCAAEKNILQTALSSPITDYEDAVQHECALAENLDAIVTRNTKDFKNSSVKVYSPAEFLQFLQTLITR